MEANEKKLNELENTKIKQYSQMEMLQNKIKEISYDNRNQFQSIEPDLEKLCSRMFCFDFQFEQI